MNESTFLTLMYIYILFVRDKYPKSLIRDFRKNVISRFKESNNISHFLVTFRLFETLTYDNSYNRLCNGFERFIRENNILLGYKS